MPSTTSPIAETSPLSEVEPSYDISTLLKIPITATLPPSAVTSLLNKPPFLPIKGALNIRTLPLPSTSELRIYRSGQLNHIPTDVLPSLNTQYHITQIHDLRSRGECSRLPTPTISGVKNIWLPHEADAGRAKETYVPMEKFAEGDGEEKGLEAYVERYANVLSLYGEVYKVVFEWIRDNEAGEGGILFRCAAGRDRTGILAALILALANVSAEEIEFDYTLTRIGTEPFREILLDLLIQAMGFKSIEEAFEKKGFVEMCGLYGKVMTAFLDSMNEKWGVEFERKSTGGQEKRWPGVEGWLTKELGFDTEDVKKMQINLGVPL